MNQDQVVGLDFETYCALDLTEVGLARYVAHPSFQVTLAAVYSAQGAEVFPFVGPDKVSVDSLLETLNRFPTITAHNAGFERAVLRALGIKIEWLILDSAVVAAVAGADRHLAGAARQLLSIEKLDEDRSLLNLFAKRQPGQLSEEFDEQLVVDNPEKWLAYQEYCARDAELSRLLTLRFGHSSKMLFDLEMRYARLTEKMNETGWPVDVDAVHEMLSRYLKNIETAKELFAQQIDADLNVFSHAQVKKWCADRGIRSQSFDKQNVERMLKRLSEKQKKDGFLTQDHRQVMELLILKRTLGGSSLKKLETILSVTHEGRAYDQYVHAGAAQTLRTSGRSIQMQNLPRLPAVPKSVSTLHNPHAYWSNDDLAENLRQVFTSSRPDGWLVVADFSSIESRALAYQAGEDWKIAAYVLGEDVYKQQAMKIFGIPYVDQVTDAQRTTGKVGELSCGYGAGPGAVKDFASKMGVNMSEAEAAQLVSDWRDANPKIVDLWDALNDALFKCVKTGKPQQVEGANSLSYRIAPSLTPMSLTKMAPDAMSVTVEVRSATHLVFTRVFHGCYIRGRDVHYYKPSHLKGGKPWRAKYVDPKTKRQVYYKLYGGKLAGILTQSMCREIFFEALFHIDQELSSAPNAGVIGQFHDEIVVDWWPSNEPGACSLDDVHRCLHQWMSHSQMFSGLPLDVKVKHDHRYTK